jgi:DNA relaxase NicK
VRFYDKNLESNGQQNCCRWEVEFAQTKADIVFKKLAETCGNLDAFATLCGSLVAGSVTFIHRTGEKNLGRLELYEWWEKILKILGKGVAIRVRREKDSLTGKMTWVKKSVSPSLACLRKVFVTDRAFLRWLFDVLKEGSARMNPYTQQIAMYYEASLDYHWGNMEKSYEERDYELSQL